MLVAAFLALVAHTRRDEPLYALSALHVGLLALLLMPYVLPEQPLPSPAWRMLLDAADLAAKLLLVAVTAHLANAWSPRLQRGLWMLAGVGLPLDLLAGWRGWAWSDFGHLWAWWALGLRAALFASAWLLALRALRAQPSLARWGTAALVGFSASTWAGVSLGVLVFKANLVDSNAAAHLGWVMWVALLLQRHFNAGAQHERHLREQLARELAAREAELQQAFDARAQAERERAASEQRRRLLNDLHDGLGAQLLHLRLRASDMTPDELALALDACLLEMRLSVDTLADTEGDLGVLLGSWRLRVEPVLRSAGLRFDWQVRATPQLDCLRGQGALELVRGLQELLANCIRHAGAQRLIVSTEIDGPWVKLWLVDDGSGLAPGASPGQGRRSLTQRALRLGGHIEWHSPAARSGFAVDGRRIGTAVLWRLPADLEGGPGAGGSMAGGGAA